MSARWSKLDDALLAARSCEVPVAQLARELGRTEASVRRRMARTGISRKRTHSLTRLAASCGVDRSVVERLGRELGMELQGNGRPGRARRYTVGEAQAEQIACRLDEKLSRWSRDFDRCRSCGSDGKHGEARHHAGGVCRRCFKRAWRRQRNAN